MAPPMQNQSYLLKALLVFYCIVPAFLFAQKIKSNSWAETKTSGSGVLTFYWFESRPFIYKNEVGQLMGIEHDVMLGFTQYLKAKHGISLQVQWIEAAGFQNVIDRVGQSTEPCFGASAFSITDERKKTVDFSPTYMADIMVMISNKDIRMMESVEDFYKTFSSLTAITIKGTTYEKDLVNLRKNFEIPFTIEYIPSAQNILQAVERKSNAFGFIDLPIYLMYFSNNPTVNVRRQNYYPVKRKGYGLAVKKNSDWLIPLSEYIMQPGFKAEFENIMPHYLDLQLYKFVEELSLKSNSNVELLNKEKEIQSQDIAEKSQQIKNQTKANYILACLVVFATTLLTVSIILYNKRLQQGRQIVDQQKNIELKNTQLQKRNEALVALNDEKNNLIKVLAHDMRSPLSQIQGLSQILLMNDPARASEDKQVIQSIQQGTARLTKMISNILDVDAIEGNRVNLVTENFGVVPVVAKVVESFRKMATDKNISLNLATENPNAHISVDPLYFTQIIENLISNAIKFSHADKKVNVIVTSNRGKTLISVKDQGPGLSEQDQQNLFKKFHRLSARPTGGESSTGLGLSIVKRYTELMGGRVWCESEPGMGSSFNVEFQEAT